MLTRRTATVTISAPDASTAAAFSSKLLYLPVPTISRDVNVRPATVQLSARISCCAVTQPPPTKCTISNQSPSSTQTSRKVERGTICEVALDRDPAGIEPKLVQHLDDADSAGHPPVLAIDADRKAVVRIHGTSG